MQFIKNIIKISGKGYEKRYEKGYGKGYGRDMGTFLKSLYNKMLGLYIK